MYLFSLLSSPLNRYVFEKLFQLENEQYGTFLVIRRIKEFLRVPKITKTNQAVKDEIMRCAVEMLDLEEKTLSDFVDLSDILVQKLSWPTKDAVFEKLTSICEDKDYSENKISRHT